MVGDPLGDGRGDVPGDGRGDKCGEVGEMEPVLLSSGSLRANTGTAASLLASTATDGVTRASAFGGLGFAGGGFDGIGGFVDGGKSLFGERAFCCSWFGSCGKGFFGGDGLGLSLLEVSNLSGSEGFVPTTGISSSEALLNCILPKRSTF